MTVRRVRAAIRGTAVAAAIATTLLLAPVVAGPIVGRPDAGPAAQAAPVPGEPMPDANPNANANALASAPAVATNPISMKIVSMSPIAPPAAVTDTTVTVVVTLTNDTDNALQQVQLRAVRDSPIVRQSALDGMLANPAAPADSALTQPLPTTKYAAAIAPHSSVQLSYQFAASSINRSGALCLCQTGIYPIDLSAYSAASTNATPTQVAWAQTYLVSVTTAPVTEQVSWLWPLIDQPHRMSDTGPFLNDTLAGEVAPGGRLDRALRVLEQVGAAAQVTVVIDPELLDELEQMSTGYRVQSATGTVAGAGSAVAADWLVRFRTVASTLPIEFSAYGDPAINAVAAAHQTSQSTLPAAMAVRVADALGRPVTAGDSTLAWPPGETLTADGLQQVAQTGATAVVLNDSTLPGGKTANPALPAVATVAVPSDGTVTALVTSSALEKRVDGLLATNGSQVAELPALLAELALRTLQAGASPSYVVLTPDRYIDTDPVTAAAVISATTQASWAKAITALTATTSVAPTDHGSLTPPAANQFGGSAALIAQAGTASALVAGFTSALQPADALTLFSSYPLTFQLAQSASWAADAGGAAEFGTSLSAGLKQLTGQVVIAPPANDSYSLASSSSPLLVTVVNNLSVPVTVQLTMSSVGGVRGFQADGSGPQVIPANSRRTLKVQAHVARSGHFRVQAQLLMPSGAAFGAPVALSIYSSALGTVGVIITIVAAAVLLLALIVRFTRRWRHHRELIRHMMAEEQLVPAGARG